MCNRSLQWMNKCPTEHVECMLKSSNPSNTGVNPNCGYATTRKEKAGLKELRFEWASKEWKNEQTRRLLFVGLRRMQSGYYNDNGCKRLQGMHSSWTAIVLGVTRNFCLISECEICEFLRSVWRLLMNLFGDHYRPDSIKSSC